VRSIKYSIFLPCVQLPLAIALWEWGRESSTPHHLDTFYWSTPALICYGLNAPALVFKLLAVPFNWLEATRHLVVFRGYELADCAFFLGVAILWFVVGLELEDRWRSDGRPGWQPSAAPLMVDLVIAIVGLALLVEAIDGFRMPWKWNNRTGNLIESALFLVWSGILVWFASTDVRRRFRASR
jgi:hypothetical protein